MSSTDGNIRERVVAEEMKEAYLTYAMSVIVSRALPDVRDGLKPSQRRILVSMRDLNLGPRSRSVKCAKIVGECMGKYHPHGDQAIYPTLVRLAQPWSCRYPLIRGQGNFGNIDGDSAAAMRYTEATTSDFTQQLTEDIEKDTVDYQPNYDESSTEPTVLPSKFPNLLCNGSSGIAVGMATSIPPNNLREVCDAIIYYINNPECAVRDLMQFVQAPDFPTGGIIVGRRGIYEGYTTGRGTITVRAKAHFETGKGEKTSIVFTEIPYQLTKETIKASIVHLVKAGKIEGISDMRDESDRDGLRLVVELKRDATKEVVLNHLYKHTSLQSSFSLNLVALVDGRPLILNLKQLIASYCKHREEIIVRRTKYLLDKAERQAHILEGLKIAIDNIDEIVEIIKKSPSIPEAQKSLIRRFSLSEIQAEAILKMQLGRLTGLERDKIEKELRDLYEEIAGYKAILADRNLVLDIIREDMIELKERFGDERRTSILDQDSDIEIEDLIADESVAVVITHDRYIKRMSLSSFRTQGRGGKGVTGGNLKEGDFIEEVFVASTHDYLLFFTSKGRLYWLKVYSIPEGSRTSRGSNLANVLEMQPDETIAAFINVREFSADKYLIMTTKKGIIKKTPLEDFGRPRAGGIIAATVDDDDALIGVRQTSGTNEIILATRNGMSIRFHEEDVRAMGRNARGVIGIKLRKDDEVVSIDIVDTTMTLLTVCQSGYGKRTNFDEYRKQGRGGSGIINIKTAGRNGPVVGVLAVKNGDHLMQITKEGQVVRIRVDGLRVIGRATSGVKCISLNENDTLVSVCKVAREEGDDEAVVPIPESGPEVEETLEEGTVEGEGAETETAADEGDEDQGAEK